MKKIWKLPTVVILCSILLFAPMGTAFAGDKNPPKDSSDDTITIVITSTTYDFPSQETGQNDGSGITPDSVYQLPHGGTATAANGISYNSWSLDGWAYSSISADAQFTWTLCAGVDYLKRDGVKKSSASYTCHSLQTPGSSIQRNTGTVLGSPYGHTWTIYTHHLIQSPILGDTFGPALSGTANL